MTVLLCHGIMVAVNYLGVSDTGNKTDDITRGEVNGRSRNASCLRCIKVLEKPIQ